MEMSLFEFTDKMNSIQFNHEDIRCNMLRNGLGRFSMGVPYDPCYKDEDSDCTISFILFGHLNWSCPIVGYIKSSEM
jgi:hypothetical protein